jgi:hypothetical protein
MTRARLVMWGLCVAAAARATPAVAQTVLKPPVPREHEAAIAVVVAGPASLGSTAATFIRPNGTPLELFRVENRLAFRYGVEAVLGYQLARRFWLEGAGSWTRGDVESRIESDFEDATLLTAAMTLSRFAVEGGGLVALNEPGAATWFLRGTAGWMRELGGDNVIAENGIIGNAGFGVKYWWRDAATGRRTIGLRLEARANVRSRGISLGEDKLRVAGVGFAGLMFGW